MTAELQILADRSYFPAALVITAAGIWLALAGRVWLARLMGLALGMLGAVALLLVRFGAGDGTSAQIPMLAAAIGAAYLGLGAALIARLRDDSRSAQEMQTDASDEAAP